MATSTPQVAIIGAGPYGLAAAAHLEAAGVPAFVFGKPMEFWQRQMPAGMRLRSSWDASHIGHPQGALTLDEYQRAQGVRLETPIPLEDFVNYGLWYQRQTVPNLDSRRVTRIERAQDDFRLDLEDGEALRVRRVIVATGLAAFVNRPTLFDGLPASLVSHASDHSDLGEFAGQEVVVVGGGQSALESAVLLSEAGAEVEVVVRAPRVRWLRSKSWMHGPLRWLRTVLYRPTDVGPAGVSVLVSMPDVFRRLPRPLQDRLAYRSIRPAVSHWLRPRASRVRVTTGRQVISAAPAGERVAIALDDGTERVVQHVLLATGYRIDVGRHPLLDPKLVRSLRVVGGYPVLRSGFESSVPGLHFLGAPAAWSFGPLVRFVSGTPYSARALTKHVLASPNPSADRLVVRASAGIRASHQNG